MSTRREGQPPSSFLLGDVTASPPEASSPRRPEARGSAQTPAIGDNRPTVALSSTEIEAIVQHDAATGCAADHASPTVEMLPVERLPAAPAVPTTKLQPVMRPMPAQGSGPVQKERGTRRSREMLRVEDIKPGASRSDD